MGGKPELPPLPEPFKYPEGVIDSACVCGSWPGGPCLKCKIVRPYIAEQMDAHGLACYRKAIEDATRVCETIENEEWDHYKGRGSGPDRAKRADPHVQGVSDGACQCATAIRALGGAAPTGEQHG